MIIAAVDLGKARTGIAVCDKTEFLASPHTVIFEKSPEKLFEKVKETVVNLKAEIVVVVFLKIWTAVRARVAECKSLCRATSYRNRVEVDLQDERGTTITAHNFLNDTNTRGKKRKNVVDEVAATIICKIILIKERTVRIINLYNLYLHIF